MASLLDLTGKSFGRWTVIEKGFRHKNQLYWKCRCECGTIKEVLGVSLREGRSTSCGCLRNELKHKVKNVKHGYAHKEKLYACWCAMKQRCFNKKSASYKWYGAKGITVCEEWEKDYLSFREWALNNGWRENLSLDRIESTGNYCPENCRWSDWYEQENNRCICTRYEYKGNNYTISQLSKISGIKRNCLKRRIDSGMTIKDAVETPVKKRIFTKKPEFKRKKK